MRQRRTDVVRDGRFLGQDQDVGQANVNVKFNEKAMTMLKDSLIILRRRIILKSLHISSSPNHTASSPGSRYSITMACIPRVNLVNWAGLSVFWLHVMIGGLDLVAQQDS